MTRRKFIRDSVGFAFSQYLARLALMARGVVGAALVGPSAYGAWNALMLVLEYASQSQLGTQQGLDQIVPQRIVDADPGRLERTKRAGLFNIVGLGLLLFPLLALLFHFTGKQILDFWGASGVALVLVCMLLGNVLNYHGTLLRSHGDIGAVSMSLMLQSLVGAGLGLAAIPWLGVWGLLWGWLAGSLVGLAYARWRSRGRVPLAPAPSAEGRELLVVGFPIFLFLGVTFVMRSLDRLMVLRYLGTTQLGYYTLAIMAVTFLLYLSDSVSYVLYPRLVARYREQGGDPRAMQALVMGPQRALSLLLPWVTALVYLSADELVSWVLPKFRPGIPALRGLSFGTVGLALGSIPAFALITVGRMRALVAVSAASALLALGLDLTVIRLGHGIKAIAAATLAAYLFNGALLQWLMLRQVLAAGSRHLVQLARLHAPLVLAIGLAFGVEHLTPGIGIQGWTSLWRLVLTLALFTGLYAVLVAPLARGLGVRGALREIRLPGLPRPEREDAGA